MTPTEIRTAWFDIRNSEKGIHALEIAERLGVSEAELYASAVGSTEGPVRTKRLEADFRSLIAKLPRIGFVKTVTRNADAVIEVEGNYDNIEFFGPMGQSVSTIDLRIFVERWKSAFEFTDETRRGTSRGLAFFDKSGRAIHKLFLREKSDVAFFETLVTESTSKDQSPTHVVEKAAPLAATKDDSAIDVEGLRAAWKAMTDTHQFFGLLRKFEVGRTQALRLVGDEFSKKVDSSTFEKVLTAVAEKEVPFMIFVGNPGVIQIFSGLIKKVVPMGSWINVLDPGFDLHVRNDRIEEAWVVRKPTVDGVVTALELYDAEGEQIALVVGKRKPGHAENADWRALVESFA